MFKYIRHSTYKGEILTGLIILNAIIWSVNF